MNAVTPNSALAPVALGNRLIAIDVLRGVALLGILLINISTFALPERYLETIMHSRGGADYNIAFLVTMIIEGKMRAMFSMIFGAGVLLFIRDKESSGKSSAVVFYSRMLWLAVFGLLHAHILLWGGDILYIYALCGFILYLFRNTKPTFLIAAMIAVTVIEMGLNTYFYNHSRSQRLAYLQVQEIEKKNIPLTDEQLVIKNEWLEKEKGYYPDPKTIEKTIEIKRSDYWTMAKEVRHSMVLRETRLVPVVILDPIAIMFLGMALFQLGFLSGQLDRNVYLWTLLVSYGIGLPIELHSWSNALKFPNQVQFLEMYTVNIGVYIYPLERTLLMIGHVSLVLLLFKSGWFKIFFNMLAAVGRMAFSNYIMQSVVCSLVFFGYGFGFFARLHYYELFFIVVAIWAFQLIVSPIWLTYFRFGPLEWAWRSLTYWQRQPMRITDNKRRIRSVA